MRKGSNAQWQFMLGRRAEILAVWLPANSFFSSQGSWLVSQREQRKRETYLIEKKAKDLTWWKLNSSVFLLRLGTHGLWVQKQEGLLDPSSFSIDGCQSGEPLMTASCKWRNEGRGTRSSVAIACPELRCFWKDVQLHPASAFRFSPVSGSLPRDLALSVLPSSSMRLWALQAVRAVAKLNFNLFNFN